MAILEIVTVPHPVLKQEAEEVHDINSEIENLVRDMTETMYHAPGVGLAANQVGVAKKIAVVDVSESEDEKETIVLINPCIVKMDGKEKDDEGCLSVPELRAEVERAYAVTVMAKDLKGEEIEIEAEGYMARVLQHEIDHLLGTLFIDHIGRLKRSLYLKKLKKSLRE